MNIECLDEMEREWFKRLIEEEIEETKGTIRNVRVFQKGCETDDYETDITTFEESIIRLSDYVDFLQNILTQLN